VWEWRHPDPVGEIRLLGERNFAIANFFYFLFGFTLFGSTVLIPQMPRACIWRIVTVADLTGNRASRVSCVSQSEPIRLQ